MKYEPRQLKSGSWNLCVYDYTDDEGNKHFKSITDKNRRTVIEMAKKFVKDRERRKDEPQLQYADMSLKQACDRYIELKREVLSPTTIRLYRGYSEAQLHDLAEMVLRYIDSKKVQQYVSECKRQGNTPKTIKNKVTFIKTVIDYFNPNNTIKIRYPQADKPEIYAPTIEDFWKIYDAAVDEIKAPIILGGMAGLRRGEICALTPEDVTDLGVNITKAKVKGASVS